MDWKLELIAVPVTDVDRAKEFYERIGFVVDHDHAVSDEIRFVQLTPPGPPARSRSARESRRPSRARSRGCRSSSPAPSRPAPSWLTPASRSSEVQDFPWGRFVFFSDPDGNGWAVQELVDPAASTV